MQLIKKLINCHSQSPLNQAISQLAKTCKSTMHKVLMLQQQIEELHAANQHQKQKREASRFFIALGGILTGAQGQQLAQEAEQALEGELQEWKKQAPLQCSNCHLIDHLRT